MEDGRAALDAGPLGALAAVERSLGAAAGGDAPDPAAIGALGTPG